MPGTRKRWLIVPLCAGLAVVVSLAIWYWWQPTFTGQLVDVSGSPLAGISVHSGDQVTISDAQGNFQVRVPTTATSLTIGDGDDALVLAISLDSTTKANQAQLADTEITPVQVADLDELFGSNTNSVLTSNERTDLETEITNGYYPPVNQNTSVITVPTVNVDPGELPPLVDPTTIITNDEGVDVVQGEIIIGWQPSVTLDQRTAIVTAAGATIRYDDPETQTTIAYVSDQVQVPTVVAALAASSQVTGALQNYLLEPDALDLVPTDPDYATKAKSWWLRRMNMEPAWTMSKGSGQVVVAVIDVGFELDHPDLVGAFTRTTLNFTTDAIDVKAKHGTHVSGIIAARQNNGEGLTGVAPRVRVLPIKLYDLGRLPKVYNKLQQWPGVRIASMSMGWGWGKKNKKRIAAGLPPFTQAVMQQHAAAYDAIIRPSFQKFYQRGGVMCKSAGNDSGYDAALNGLDYPEVITVAAGMPNGSVTNFSNVGATIDIVAPGYKIWSPVAGHTYDYLSGTSMATPATCGSVALIRSLRPTYSPLLVKLILQKGATEPTTLAANYHYLDTWRALLRATKRFGVTGSVVDKNLSGVSNAEVTTQPSAWSIVTNNDGDYLIPFLLRTKRTLHASKGDKKGKEIITPPPLSDDEVLELVWIELEDEEEENENDNNNNDNDNNDANANDNANTNTGTDGSDNTDDADSSDSVDSNDSGQTTLSNGVVVSAAGCGVSGFSFPPAEGDCAPGYYFSRETIACEQIQCPDGVGRNYTLECKCEGEGRRAIYACDQPGYMVACVQE